jgi:hypothetical protein
MTTQLHQLIAAIAKNDPAIHVSELVLINLITNRLDKALNTFLGFYQKYRAVRSYSSTVGPRCGAKLTQQST